MFTDSRPDGVSACEPTPLFLHHASVTGTGIAFRSDKNWPLWCVDFGVPAVGSMAEDSNGVIAIGASSCWCETLAFVPPAWADLVAAAAFFLGSSSSRFSVNSLAAYVSPPSLCFLWFWFLVWFQCFFWFPFLDWFWSRLLLARARASGKGFRFWFFVWLARARASYTRNKRASSQFNNNKLK